MRPSLISHADWSIHAPKRWVCQANLIRSGQYVVQTPRPVGDSRSFITRTSREAHGTAFMGFDFPLGLPLAYARQAGIDDFPAWLLKLGRGKWAEFYQAAERKDEISLFRPFYPHRPGGTSQAHLVEQLHVENIDALRRRCELARPGRRAAAPLFWTLGAQQVGKAAISGWRDLLVPALGNQALDVALWPFAGSLPALLATRKIVVAETYPAECYAHLGLHFGSGQSKRKQEDRVEKGKQMIAWADNNQVILTPHMETALQEGFGAGKDGEDPFDAVVGLLGMINVAQGVRPPGTPKDPDVRQVEGWILGQLA